MPSPALQTRGRRPARRSPPRNARATTTARSTASRSTVRGDARLLRRAGPQPARQCRAATARRRSRVAVARDGRAAPSLEVVDAGAGIPEAERERVFTPFHRVGGDEQGRRARARAGAADRAPARRRRDGRAAARTQPSCFRRQHAGALDSAVAHLPSPGPKFRIAPGGKSVRNLAGFGAPRNCIHAEPAAISHGDRDHLRRLLRGDLWRSRPSSIPSRARSP